MMSSIGRHRSVAVLVIALFISVLYAVTWFSGGVTHMASSWFCLPVIAAGAYLGYIGGLGAALSAALLAGPLMPLEVATQATQAPSLWIARSILFIIVALLGAFAASQIRASYQRQLDLVESSRDLAIRKAAMVEMVSREFRAPLTALSAASQALARDGMVAPEAQPMLEGLSSGTSRLMDLVAAVGVVLEVEEHGSGLRQETFSVKSMLTKVVDHLGVRDPWSRVTIEIATPAKACRTDPEFLGQLLQHLIGIAVRGSDAEVLVRVGRPSYETFTFDIIDKGPGMDERLLLLAGDPFSTGILKDDEQRGAGLGLFAATRLVGVLGGSLTFSEAEDGGTIASVSIPATSPESLLG